MNDLTIEKVWEGKRVTHWRVSRGQKGGEAVTVRVSDFGIYVCLTCRVGGLHSRQGSSKRRPSGRRMTITARRERRGK